MFSVVVGNFHGNPSTSDSNNVALADETPVEQPLLSATSHMATLPISDYQYGTPCDIYPHDPLRACDLLYPVVYKEAYCLPLMQRISYSYYHHQPLQPIPQTR